jgi:hypothetical protein
MSDYQLFVLTPEGDVKERYKLKCANDDKATSLARNFSTDDLVEVWDGPRFVVRLPSKVANQPE